LPSIVGGLSNRGRVTGEAFSGGNAGAAPFAVAVTEASFALADGTAGLGVDAALGDGLASGAATFTAAGGGLDWASALIANSARTTKVLPDK